MGGYVQRYMYPFPKGYGWKSQEFGANPSNGINPVGGHTGDDWAVPTGTPIYAAGDGIIEFSSWATDNYLDSPWWLTKAGGDDLVLNCGDNAPTFIYGHLLDSMPPVGTVVKKGQIIALSGNSGTATSGPHTHVEIMPPNWDFNNGTYGRVNPEIYFNEFYVEEEVMPNFDPTEQWYQAMIGAQARIDARTLYVKGDKEPTVYDITGGVPRALTLPEFIVLREANQPLKEMDQKLINDFISDYNARNANH